jgi:probable rRNA maturation factor
VYNRQRDLPIKTSSVQEAVMAVLAQEKIETDEIAVHFVSVKEICNLHQKFFQDPTKTDCITLPMDSPDENSPHVHFLGEIFICPKVALEFVNSSETKNSATFYAETSLYLVHGILHLLGYSDCKVGEKKKMRAAEKRIMGMLTEKSKLLQPK